MIQQFIDLFLHLDQSLGHWTQQLGPWVYVILFLIIFAETGVIIFPILPGDSLLFAAGAVAAIPASNLNVISIWIVLILASFLGDNLNYQIGKRVGSKIFSRPKSFFFNPQYLIQAKNFYEKHGAKTIFLARFLPILRTFAPFVAGIAHMQTKMFVFMSAVGSVCWISIFLFAGYYFGNIPWVQKNFTVLIMAVIAISMLPAAIGFVKMKIQAVSGAK
jgi:membrane-associated protein